MEANLHSIAGVSAGILIFLSYSSYIISTVRGKTKPNRATWFMLATISTIIAISYHDLGATSTFWAAGSAAMGTLIVAFLSIKYGTGGWSWLERICIIVSGFSLLFYIVTENAFLTLVFSLLMDGAALAPTIYHAYVKPHEEDRNAWTLTFVADILAVVAIDRFILQIAIYPLYMLLVNGIVTTLLYRPFFKKKKEVS